MGDAITVTDLGINFHVNKRGRRRRRRQIRELFRPGGQDPTNQFWALRDISFTLEQGEAVGIVGGNGSGKSTLLRLIAGVLLPDEGTVQVNGGVGAMLELSAGFVNSLTARDNVYLLSALHGFGREEIDERFDEIIRWAEVENFVDTQIRHFSSGMKARLAFSVVTRLEEPILLVDEILAVGDRCLQTQVQGRDGEHGGRRAHAPPRVAQRARTAPAVHPRPLHPQWPAGRRRADRGNPRSLPGGLRRGRRRLRVRGG